MEPWVVQLIGAFGLGAMIGKVWVLPDYMSRRKRFRYTVELQREVRLWWIYHGAAATFFICTQQIENLANVTYVVKQATASGQEVTRQLMSGSLFFLSALVGSCVMSHPGRWKAPWRPLAHIPAYLWHRQKQLQEEINRLSCCGTAGDEAKKQVQQRLRDVEKTIRAYWGVMVLQANETQRLRLVGEVATVQECPGAHPRLEDDLSEWYCRLGEIGTCTDPVQALVANARNWLTKSLEGVAQQREKHHLSEISGLVTEVDTQLQAEADFLAETELGLVNGLR